MRNLGRPSRSDFVQSTLCEASHNSDIFCSGIVLALREKNPAVKLHCILPCKEQADKWAASSRDLYYSILDRAISLVYVSRTYHKNCMLERNRFLVDYAAILLAVYNGERRIGTAATLRYAQKMGREIIVINPITRLISHSNSTRALPQF